MVKTKEETPERLSTGIVSLDEVLHGGLISKRAYIVRGGPGTGKTTLGLHFLTAGVLAGERTLLITLDESKDQIRKDAEKIGFDMDKIACLDLSPTAEFFSAAQAYDIFSPSEVEREPTTKKILEQMEKLKPQRVFIDAITQFRYLSTDAFQFRKQVVSFLRFLIEHGATVLFTSESSPEAPDNDLQFLSDGVIDLGVNRDGRTLTVHKFRGSDFHSGCHTLQLSGIGVEVFPRLAPGEYRRDFLPEIISSGVPELDEMLHGGLERGTVTIITGPTGVGKTTLGTLFMKEAAGRGERSVLYTFEENVETLLQRCEAINIPIHTMIQRDILSLVKVEPMQYSPNEFACYVRREVEKNNARIVMIDSMSGYKISLAGENLVGHIHALTKYLANMGVTVLLINELEAITGDFRATEIGISYLADNIIFLRYLEFGGEIQKAIGVLKKRVSDFEKSLRKIEITRYGVKVGKPLADLRGILSGTPILTGTKE